MLNEINWTNRIPVDVLSNGAVKYGIYDENGSLLRYEYIKKEDGAVVQGVNINKTQGDLINDNFDKIQQHIDLFGKYTIPNLTQPFIETNSTTNIIPTSDWVQVTQYLDYTNGEWEIIAGSRQEGSATNAVDGDLSTNLYFNRGSAYGTTQSFIIKNTRFGGIKVNKFKTKISASSQFQSCVISGSNDNLSYTDLYTFTDSQSSLTELIIPTPAYYSYYKFTVTMASTTYVFRIYEIQTSDADIKTYRNLFTLNYDLDSYEVGTVAKIKVPNGIATSAQTYININNLGEKLINGTLNANELYELVYNGTSFDSVAITPQE